MFTDDPDSVWDDELWSGEDDDSEDDSYEDAWCEDEEDDGCDQTVFVFISDFDEDEDAADWDFGEEDED